MAAFAGAGEEVGIVYSPCVGIDEKDQVWCRHRCMGLAGNVFEPHLAENFVGNGSGITVRTGVARELGGYYPGLRDQAAQGHEDWLFQLRVAYKYHFLCVPLYLIGYRRTEDNMSSDYLQMARSGLEAMRNIEAHATEIAAPVFWWPRARACGQLVFRLSKSGAWAEAIDQLVRESRRNPLVPFYLPVVLANRIYARVEPLVYNILRRGKKQTTSFHDLDPRSVVWGAPKLTSYFWLYFYGWIARRRSAGRQGNGTGAPGEASSSQSAGLVE